MSSLKDFKDKMAQLAADAAGRPKPGPDDCQGCGTKSPLVFDDYMSKKEFALSGLCQKCQNDVFDNADGFDDGFDDILDDEHQVF